MSSPWWIPIPRVVGEAEAVFTADWAHRAFTGNAAALVLSPANSRSKITALITGAQPRSTCTPRN